MSLWHLLSSGFRSTARSTQRTARIVARPNARVPAWPVTTDRYPLATCLRLPVCYRAGTPGRRASALRNRSIACLRFRRPRGPYADADSDVLYELEPGWWLGWEIEQLVDELADVLGRPVDLISSDALHPRLKDAVLSEARTLYAA